MKRLWVCSGLFLLIAPFPVAAQTSSSDAETIRALIARVDQLEKRVAELESEHGAPAAPAPQAAVAPRAAPQPAPQAAQVAVAPPAAAPQTTTPPPAGEALAPSEQMARQEHMRSILGSQVLPQTPTLHLQGFSDFNFSATTQRGTTSGFNEGQFVLHISSALSQRVNVFSELSLTARRDAGMGSPPATGFNAEVERLLIRFDANDAFKVSFGRYHTPINYWNTAFHHGQWLQTTISRPEMTQFGGNFIPVHFVGGLAEGEIPSGGLHLNYDVGLGNGRGSIISRAGDAGDINNNRAWLVNLYAKPDRFYGLQAGGSAYRDKISVLGRNFDEWITSGHIVWLKEKPEFIAEIANVNHAEIGRPGSSNSLAYYVQVAYRLPWFEQLWKPYYRFEYIHVPRADTVFSGVPSLAGSVVGVRYDITTFAAFKAEWRNQRRPGLERINGAFVQTSFTF